MSRREILGTKKPFDFLKGERITLTLMLVRYYLSKAFDPAITVAAQCLSYTDFGAFDYLTG
jgi:hypothetical protein